MAKVMVKVVQGRGWSGGPLGSKDDTSDPFEYDVSADPLDLVRTGLVEKVPEKEPAKKG